MRTLLLFALVLMVVIEGCKQPSGTSADDLLYDILSKSGGEVVLEFGEKRVIGEGDFTIEFVDVIGDSRCPQKVTCVWAGNGEVEILLNDEKVYLNTYVEPHEAVVSGVSLELAELSPYPVYEQSLEKEDYKVRLLIMKQ